MKYSQIRIALLTFTLGLVSIPFADFLQAKWIESSVELPEIESESPVIRVCPKYEDNKAGYINGKYDSFIDMCQNGEGGSGGNGEGLSVVICNKYTKAVEISKKVRKIKRQNTPKGFSE